MPSASLSNLPKALDDIRGLLNTLDLNALNREIESDLQARVAIVGTVNSGKSTLLNHLIGKSVSKVSDLPGTTTTNIAKAFGPFELVDTPGFGDPSQSQRADTARAAMRAADVIMLLIDATMGVRQIDLDLFNELVHSSRPLVVALNKMDLVAREANAVISTVESRLGRSVIPISGRTGLNISEQLIPRLVDEHQPLAVALGRALPEYRSMLAEKIIRKAATVSMLAGFEPIPGIDIPILLLGQARLVLRLAALYGENLTMQMARELIVTIAGGVVARYLGEQAAKFLPGPGWLISAGFAAAGTYAIGQVAKEYFESGRRIPIEELRAQYERIVAERRNKKVSSE
jgi:small GTP-binding protein